MNKTITVSGICKECDGAGMLYFGDVDSDYYDSQLCSKCNESGVFGYVVVEVADIEKMVTAILESEASDPWGYKHSNSHGYLILLDQLLQYIPKKEAINLINVCLSSHYDSSLTKIRGKISMWNVYSFLHKIIPTPSNRCRLSEFIDRLSILIRAWKTSLKAMFFPMASCL